MGVLIEDGVQVSKVYCQHPSKCGLPHQGQTVSRCHLHLHERPVCGNVAPRTPALCLGLGLFLGCPIAHLIIQFRGEKRGNISTPESSIQCGLGGRRKGGREGAGEGGKNMRRREEGRRDEEGIEGRKEGKFQVRIHVTKKIIPLNITENS